MLPTILQAVIDAGLKAHDKEQKAKKNALGSGQPTANQDPSALAALLGQNSDPQGSGVNMNPGFTPGDLGAPPVYQPQPTDIGIPISGPTQPRAQQSGPQAPQLNTSGSDALRNQAMQILLQAQSAPHPQVTGHPNNEAIALALLPALLGIKPTYLGPLVQGYQQGQDKALAKGEQTRNQGIALAGSQASGLNSQAQSLHQDEVTQFNQSNQNYRNDSDNERMFKVQEIGNKLKSVTNLNKSFENTLKESEKIHKDFVAQNGREMNAEEQKAFAEGNIVAAVNHYNDEYKKLTGEELGLDPQTYVNRMMALAQANPGKTTAKQANADRNFTFKVDKAKFDQEFKGKTFKQKQEMFDKRFDEQVREFEKTNQRQLTAQERLDAYRTAQLAFEGQRVDISKGNSEIKQTPAQKQAHKDYDEAFKLTREAYEAMTAGDEKDKASAKIIYEQRKRASDRLKGIVDQLDGASNSGKASGVTGSIKTFGNQLKTDLGGRYEQYGPGSIAASLHPAGKALDLYPGKSTPTDFQKAVDYAKEKKVPYIIYNRKSYTLQKDGSYLAKNYKGPDPHTDHVHIDWKGQGPGGSGRQVRAASKTPSKNLVETKPTVPTKDTKVKTKDGITFKRG